MASADRLKTRLPAALLIAHIALIVFATLAMVTILAGDFPVWMRGPYTDTVYQLGWRYTGQAYVILGVLAAATHAAPRMGWDRVVRVFGVAALVALTSELIGTNVGLPFGPYHYTTMLGYRIHGDVPYAIPLSWSYMLYASLAICARIFGGEPRGAWRMAIGAGMLMVAWDVALEVQMTNVKPAHWVWQLDAAPGWIPGILTDPLFYGMPLLNWIGWLFTATVIARLMIAIVPAAAWTERIAPTALPLVLYGVNGLMPIATTARHGLWGAAVAGLVAMGAPLVLAARRSATS